MTKDEKQVLARYNIRTARHKLTLPSDEVGDYYYNRPVITPDGQDDIGMSDLVKVYLTDPFAHKGINLKANRVIGEGFQLLPSTHKDAVETLAEQARQDCESFLASIEYVTFFRQSCINAYVSGNEWTEIIPNSYEHIIALNHGDFRTMDFRRSLTTNNILLDGNGQPVGYWQYMSNISELYESLSTLYGSVETFANLQAAQKRLKDTEEHEIYDTEGRKIGITTYKAHYLFLRSEEIVHLSFNNVNDTPYGMSMLLAAYDSLDQLKIIMFASAEMIKELGMPKPVYKIGEKDRPATKAEADRAEELVQDPVRKESFVIPWPGELSYLSPPGAAADINAYPQLYITAVATGLGIPRELLTGEGEANRSTTTQHSTDFDRGIESDRKRLEEYIRKILSRFLGSRGYKSTSTGLNIFTPEIKWPEYVSDDERTRNEIARTNWSAGGITFNEYREAIGYDEIEDAERGEKFYDEIHGQMNPPEGLDQTLPEIGMFEAQHRLEHKEDLNPKLNRLNKTEDVDYKEIAQKKVGTKIKTVNPDKARQIRDVFVNGMAKKESADSILKKVMKIGGYTEKHARMILYNEQRNLMETAKFEDAKKTGMKWKKWEAVLDNVTTRISKSLHGQVRPIGKLFTTEFIDEKGKRQKWRGMAPPEFYNTRDKVAYHMEKPSSGRPKVRNYNWKGDA